MSETMEMPVKRGTRPAAKSNGTSKSSRTPVEMQIIVPELKISTMTLKVRGVANVPLVMHRFEPKSINQMLDKQMGAKAPKREVKDPLACFKESILRTPQGQPALLAVAFKKSAVKVANDLNLKQTEQRRRFFVFGPDNSELIPLVVPPLKEPLTEWDAKYWDEMKDEREFGASMRMDVVRVANGAPDIRFRAQFFNWEATMHIEYDSNIMTPHVIVSLFRQAGFGGGMGEGRPERTGNTWGRYEVA